jgi:hypothetical protein
MKNSELVVSQAQIPNFANAFLLKGIFPGQNFCEYLDPSTNFERGEQVE